MKERPILFSGPMVRAILDGRKTQTRRALGPRVLPWTSAPDWPAFAADLCPYGVPGDRLWVRETYALHRIHDATPPSKVLPTLLRDRWFRADGDCTRDDSGDRDGWWFEGRFFPGPIRPIGSWRPSIHMPRWASRILLEVTDVRAERLQDITEEDARAEGINRISHGREGYFFHHERTEPHSKNWCHADDAFRELWDSINGAGAWDRNDWVWAVSFRRVP